MSAAATRTPSPAIEAARTAPYYLRHRKSGLFVCVRGWGFELEATPAAAPRFTVENMGRRAGGWHKQAAANARKRWPRQLTRCPVATVGGEGNP